MEKTLHDLLREQLQVKGLTVQKLRQSTGIAERYIHALVASDYSKLPAAPYVRGYLLRLAPLLDLDGNELWELYQKEGNTIKTSGPEDRMPENRFALKTINKKRVGGALIVLIVLVYLAISAQRFLGQPSLKLTSPGAETVVSTASIILISGSINPRDVVQIDGETTVVDAEGGFQIEYTLQPGLNNIMISVENPIARKKTEVVRRVIYQPNAL